MHDDRLLLCPFCGGEPDFVMTSREFPHIFERYTSVVFVRCRKCRASTAEIIYKERSDYNKVADLWNKRSWG